MVKHDEVKMDEGNMSIVRMIGLYRVATRRTAAHWATNQSQADARLSKLTAAAMLRVHKNLPGNRSVYQLARKGAKVACVSEARGRMMGGQSLLKNLGILLFCHVQGTERHRVEAEPLAAALGITLDDEGAYCLCRHNSQTIAFDCYVPSFDTAVPDIHRHLRKRLRAVRQSSELSRAVEDLRYGFVIIVDNKRRRKSVMDAVRTKSAGERVPLIKRVRIWVEAIEELGVYFGTSTARPEKNSRPVEDDGEPTLWTAARGSRDSRE